MSLIESILKRRQFLIGTGLASAGALTCKKGVAFMNPALQNSVAMAAEKAAAAGIKVIPNKCPHLLSPLKIRNKVLKNRIVHCVSPVYVLQGPENYPSEAWRNHYSNIAKKKCRHCHNGVHIWEISQKVSYKGRKLIYVELGTYLQ
jgi:hypothetical protein